MEWRVCCHCSCSTAPRGWTCCRSPESELSPQVEAEMDGGGRDERGNQLPSRLYRLTRQISLIRLDLRINFAPSVCLVQQLCFDVIALLYARSAHIRSNGGIHLSLLSSSLLKRERYQNLHNISFLSVEERIQHLRCVYGFVGVHGGELPIKPTPIEASPPVRVAAGHPLSPSLHWSGNVWSGGSIQRGRTNTEGGGDPPPLPLPVSPRRFACMIAKEGK